MEAQAVRTDFYAKVPRKMANYITLHGCRRKIDSKKATARIGNQKTFSFDFSHEKKTLIELWHVRQCHYLCISVILVGVFCSSITCSVLTPNISSPKFRMHTSLWSISQRIFLNFSSCVRAKAQRLIEYIWLIVVGFVQKKLARPLANFIEILISMHFMSEHLIEFSFSRCTQ